MSENKNYSAVSVTIAGCGGCGINESRLHRDNKQVSKVLYFDTSMTNSRPGERVEIMGNGSGSGSNRSENASKIEKSISQLSDDDLGVGDVAVVMFSLGGGTGSICGPLMIREYAKRGVRVIACFVTDTSSTVAAKNNLNTLKTLSAICRNNEIYLPCIIVSNDTSSTRSAVDQTVKMLVTDLVDLLTKSVYEVDRNDRLNWINPSKAFTTQPGLKIMSFESDQKLPGDKIVLGTDSTEMVDGLLVLQSSPDEEAKGNLPPSRLKKLGFYETPYRRIVGKVSSDISSVEKIIEYVDRMEHQDKSQKHQTVSRLDVAGSDDLIL